MTKDELRECLARAISGSPFPSRRSLVRADAALAALRGAGLAIVPKEPNGVMVLAGWDSIDKTAFRRAFYNTAIPRSFMEPILDAALSAGDLLGERGS